uniref:SWIM-type domain-containing protein n=1 Tax=Setaria italica TaxID=4555 RepID=K3YMG6_SETIT
MNESVEFFEGPSNFTDLVDHAMRKYGCKVDEMTLRGRFDYGKVRAHYVLMNLASDSNWKNYKDVVHEENVACLEVIVEIVRMPGPNVVLRDEVAVVNRNGTQELEILQHVLGETKSAFDLAIANDDFPNDTFERDETNIDDDDVSMGSEDSEFEEDGVNELRLLKERDAELPSVPNDKDIRIPFSESPVIKKGMKFKSLEELKFFLTDYAVRLHRPFSVVHSNKNLRYNVMCKQGCHWRVWSQLISSTKQWRISNVVQPHTCRPSQPKRVHVQCTAKYLGRHILGIIRKDSETLIPSLVESIFAFSGYHVKYSKAWRVKQHTVALLWGDWKVSYGMVPRVLTAMVYYNPGLNVLKHVLQRVFWCFPQCSKAFQHCHPMILVDGTFLTEKYKASNTRPGRICLTPVRVIALVCFARRASQSNLLIDKERKVLNFQRFRSAKDRHHGLLNCANDHMDGFPPLVHRWCTRHFAANMSRRQKNDRVIGKLKTLCKVHTEIEFSEKLEDLVKDLNDDAKEWLKGEMEDKDKWAQAFDEGGMRWGIMTTNYSKSLNVVFKGIRSRPVSGIIEYSFEKCNTYFVDRWKKAYKFLSQVELRSGHHLAEPYGPEWMVYSIRSCATTNVGGESHGGRHYRVDLNKVSCTCNVPQLLHLPCSHFIIACKARSLNYESPLYMSPLYFREHTVRIWESSFQPYLDPSQWPTYEGVGYVPNHNLMRNKVGRRLKKRLRGDMDVASRDSHLPPPVWRDDHHMQDIAMILDLPLEGHPVMGIIQNENWRDMVAMYIGIRLPEPKDGDNSKKTSGVSSAWLREHFNVCPQGANDEVVQRYARVWLWNFVSTFLLPDAAGNTVPWMVLPILGQDWDNIALYSWGSTVLAWLYRQLCEACRRTARDSNVGGCTYMLQIWIWERMPVGRPCRLRVDIELWRCMTPMILYYVVEFHMLHRVMRQFGRMQPCPPLELSTLQQLHRIDLRKRYKENDWRLKHAQYLIQWENMQRYNPEGPSRRSRGKAPASPQASKESEGNRSEDGDPTYGEELEMSGMIDASPVTQTQGESSQSNSQSVIHIHAFFSIFS